MKANQKDIFLSVIVPVYNKEKCIARAINSILGQSFKNFELIVVCDPSTDNSSIEVAKFSDSRIRVFHREVPGPGGYSARNLGIEKAKSEWICFLDADDEFLPDHLANCYTIIVNNEVDVIVSGHIQNRKGMEVKRMPQEKFQNKVIKQKDAISFLYKKGFVNTNSIVIKKNILLFAGLFPSDDKYKRGGDVDTWLRVFIAAYNIFCSSHISSIYHLDESGVVSDHKNANGCLPVSDTVESMLLDSRISSDVAKEMKRLSNVKILSMFYSQLSIGIINHKLLLRVCYSELTFKQFFKLIGLIVSVPYFMVTKC